ncbi:DUF6350 family protein [Streptomyces sp. NPDC049555]|uniref:cell division protein PerM n=1 Tax=Streptomyces sp. NPDC049555 TaxID=3154930 RepID=UPI00343A0222
MSHYAEQAEHGTSSPTYRLPATAATSASTAFVGGVLAAGLGLGAFSMVVLAMWITSPYPDSGPGGALRIAADLWLAAHGAALVRTETLAGPAAPLALTPMLCALVPCTLLYRAARHALEPPEDMPPETPGPPPRAAFTAMAGGYLLVALAAVAYAWSSPVRPDALSTLLQLPLVTGAFVGAGVWTAAGRPGLPAPPFVRRAVPGRLRGWFTKAHLAGVVRAAAITTAVLLGGGLLLVGGTLALHAGAAQEAFVQLAPRWSGRVALALASAALLPNAAIWAAAYGLGPGFTVGGGSLVAPLNPTPDRPLLPRFPLLAALPSPGEAGPLVLAAAAALAAAAGIALARSAVPRRAAPRAGYGLVAATATLGALLCGAVMTVLAYVSSGAIGNGTLASFGPLCWHTGAAAAAWSGAIGVPGALMVRWRRGAAQDEPLRDEEGEPVPVLKGWRRVGWLLDLAVEPAPAPVPPAAPEPEPEPEPAKPRRGWWRSLLGWFGFRAPGEAKPVPTADEDVVYEPETLPLISTRHVRPAGEASVPTRTEPEDEEERRRRWAELKDSGGGLMPDFPPEGQ